MEARGTRKTALRGYNQPNPEGRNSRGQMIQFLHPKYVMRREREMSWTKIVLRDIATECNVQALLRSWLKKPNERGHFGDDWKKLNMDWVLADNKNLFILLSIIMVLCLCFSSLYLLETHTKVLKGGKIWCLRFVLKYSSKQGQLNCVWREIDETRRAEGWSLLKWLATGLIGFIYYTSMCAWKFPH